MKTAREFYDETIAKWHKGGHGSWDDIFIQAMEDYASQQVAEWVEKNNKLTVENAFLKQELAKESAHAEELLNELMHLKEQGV